MWPDDRGEWLRLIAGCPLAQGHFEMIADKIIGFELGDKIPLGKDVYTVVGVTQGMASSSGDGMAFFTARDAMAGAVRRFRRGVPLGTRSATRAHGAAGCRTPATGIAERAGGPSSALPALATPP